MPGSHSYQPLPNATRELIPFHSWFPVIEHTKLWTAPVPGVARASLLNSMTSQAHQCTSMCIMLLKKKKNNISHSHSHHFASWTLRNASQASAFQNLSSFDLLKNLRPRSATCSGTWARWKWLWRDRQIGPHSMPLKPRSWTCMIWENLDSGNKCPGGLPGPHWWIGWKPEGTSAEPNRWLREQVSNKHT